MAFSKRRRRTRRSARGGKRRRSKTKRRRKSRSRRSRKSRRRTKRGSGWGGTEQLADEDECFTKSKPCNKYWFKVPGDPRPKVCRNPQWGETCANVGAWNGQYKNKQRMFF
tara:strand:+ start:529 stop:861 length:333 start_codon:yes stop_codon:yes gene_type:complete